MKGTTGMQNQILVTNSGIGYLSPDFTSLTPKSGNYNPNVRAASLVNQFDGKSYLPTLSAITSALATSVAPPGTKAAASDPTNWIPTVPAPGTGYPVVGFSNVLVSQCYRNATITTGIKTFLQNQYNNNSAFLMDMNNAGIVQVPNLLSATYVTAINRTFLNNISGYNLNIGNPSVCKNGGTAGRYVGR